MANIKTLKDLTPGTVFDAGPIDVRVLDHMTNGTTLLIPDVIREMALAARYNGRRATA